MKFIPVVLSGVVFVLTLLTGALLFANTLGQGHFPEASQGTEGVEDAPTEEEGGIASFAKGMLSRLSLTPFRARERSFVGIMIENHEDARPYHAGLQGAVLVEEFYVEGYITRFLALFEVDRLPKSIGPVRSLRPYFIDAMLPWTHLVLHAGGSPEALARVQEDPNVDSINGLLYDHYFERNDSIAAPHNLFLTDEAVRFLVRDAEVHSIVWPTYETGRNPSDTQVPSVFVNFYNPANNITFTYDEWAGAYTRENGGIISDAHPHNVVIFELPVDAVGEHGRLSINMHQSGKALLFRGGTLQKGTWSKKDASTPFSFETEEGEPFVFSQGQTWLMGVSTFERVEYEEEGGE